MKGRRLGLPENRLPSVNRGQSQTSETSAEQQGDATGQPSQAVTRTGQEQAQGETSRTADTNVGNSKRGCCKFL